MFVLPVKIIVNAPQNQVIGYNPRGELKIKIRALPEKGKANLELVDFLSQLFSLNKSDINIISGCSSEHKLLRLAGIEARQAQQILQKLLDI